jgi:dTDP-4-dehydrorhamnose reductase
MLKIAVTGPRGRLGSELVRRGCAPIYADVTSFQSLAREVAAVSPGLIVHCAAYTDVDACERYVTLAARVNADGMRLLGQAFHGPIVYISTDYIFDGQAGPYTEMATPNPLSIYGWSKLGGEIVLRGRGDARDLIVRTTMLFDRDSSNFVTRVLDRLRTGETVYLPAELYGSPTYVPYLVDSILAAIERGVTGIVNLAGWRVMSRYEWGRQIANLWGFEPDLVQPAARGMGQAPRPPLAGLRVGKARSLGLPIGDPLDGLKEMASHAMETMAAG